MANKKTKETNKSKKTTSKPKTTKKETVKLEDQKVVENVEIKEEEKPVVVEKFMENTVEEVTVEVNINNPEEVNEPKENEEVLDSAEIADNTIPEPTEEQISEMKEMANEDDEKFEYAQSMMDNVQKVTQQEETNECNDILNETPNREEQIEAEESGEETANCQTNEAEEYKIPVDENGSNVVFVSQETSPQTCTEEKQVQEFAEEAKQEEKPKKKRRFGFMYRWFGAQIDL